MGEEAENVYSHLQLYWSLLVVSEQTLFLLLIIIKFYKHDFYTGYFLLIGLFTVKHFPVTSISLLEDLPGYDALNPHLLQRGGRKEEENMG